MKLDLQGCGTALVTPFDERGRIDFGTLGKLVDWQIREGVDFLVTCTPDGESPALSGDERRAVTAHVVKVANGRVPVAAGAGGSHTAKSVFWARDAERAGAAAIVASFPSYNLPSPEGLWRHFSAIGDATKLPMLLLNCPERTGADPAAATLLRLTEIPRVAGVVEGSRDLRKVSEFLSLCPKDFAVFSGDDAAAFAGLAAGMRGRVSLVANVAPKDTAEMTRAALTGRREDARQLAQKLGALAEVLACETSPGPVKAALAMMRRCEETLRLPLAPVRDENRRRIEKTLRTLRLLPRGVK